MSAYQKLLKSLHKGAVLGSINRLLTWDMETHMPSGASAIRAKSQALLDELIHREAVRPAYRRQLAALIELDSGKVLASGLSAQEKACLVQLRRSYLQQSRLPAAFVKKMSETTSTAFSAWLAAKHSGRYRDFLPHLEKICELARRKADFLGYREHPYDALIDIYEPQMTTGQLQSLLPALAEQLRPLLAAASAKEPASFLQQKFDVAAQRQLAEKLKQRLGLSTTTYHVGESHHPFCQPIHPSDIRITVRFEEENPLSAIFSLLHEAGHAFYEAALPAEHFGTPLGEACSFAIHESQSRLFEVFIGKSLAFWKGFYPLVQEAFPKQLGAVSLEQFHSGLHTARRSLIRIESDELSYNLHICVRFECEKALIEGSLRPAELPDFWNERMQAYVGIAPQNEVEGCMQDVHWSMGYIGYFPAYTLGNLAAAALFERIEQELPQWQQSVQEGSFGPLLTYLGEKIHRHGKRYSPTEMLRAVTGKGYDSAPLLRQLKARYAL